MYNYLLKIAYDGTAYSGWQVQPNGNSIQEEMQKALAVILRHPVHLTGSGRTDAGVHALEQTAHFMTERQLEIKSFLRSLNGLLPVDIRVKSAELVPENFHARFDARGKIYRYYLSLEPYQDPFTRLYAYHVRRPIDVDLLRQGAARLVGTHDFSSFTNEGGAAEDKMRTLHRIDIVEVPGGVYLEFEGDGFLYKMVRNCVGTLLEVAEKKRSPDSIKEILDMRDRRLAGKAVPPQGLFLVRVMY